jgi:beta-N-acetylhexosaminidase
MIQRPLNSYSGISAFSNQQIAGQRLMVGFEGTEFNQDLKFLINEIKVGGIILFARNVSTPEQINNLCFSVQRYASKCGQPPLIIAIDQEGGQVARLKEPFTQFPGNPAFKKEEDAVHFARVAAAELKRVGINMNLAPVMDIAPEEIESVMAGRVFGCDPRWVSDMGAAVIGNLQSGGIMAVAKHFPGIGRTTLDSHLDLPRLDIKLHKMESSDLLPFRAAIGCDVAGIMLSHVLYDKIDPNWPASLSKRIAKDLLRGRLKYDGFVITDDLDMGAIKKHYDVKTIIRRIQSADIDMALICHKGPDIENAFEELLKGLNSSQGLKAKGVESIRRILKLKRQYISV